MTTREQQARPTSTRKRQRDGLAGDPAAQELRATDELLWRHTYLGQGAQDYLMVEVREAINALPPDHATARALEAKAAERLHALTKEQWTLARKPPRAPAGTDGEAMKDARKAHAAWQSMLTADRTRKTHVYREYRVALAAALAAAAAAAAAHAEQLACDLALDALVRVLEDPAQAQQALPLVPGVQQVDEAAGGGLAVLSVVGSGVPPGVVAGGAGTLPPAPSPPPFCGIYRRSPYVRARQLEQDADVLFTVRAKTLRVEGR